jgi:hypothetical protein
MPTLTDPDGQFARNYNRHHFLFRHGLMGHPLFELPRSSWPSGHRMLAY